MGRILCQAQTSPHPYPSSGPPSHPSYLLDLPQSADLSAARSTSSTALTPNPVALRLHPGHRTNHELQMVDLVHTISDPFKRVHRRGDMSRRGHPALVRFCGNRLQHIGLYLRVHLDLFELLLNMVTSCKSILLVPIIALVTPPDEGTEQYSSGE